MPNCVACWKSTKKSIFNPQHILDRVIVKDYVSFLR
jgi:hypothetical protein